MHFAQIHTYLHKATANNYIPQNGTYIDKLKLKICNKTLRYSREWHGIERTAFSDLPALALTVCSMVVKGLKEIIWCLGLLTAQLKYGRMFFYLYNQFKRRQQPVNICIWQAALITLPQFLGNMHQDTCGRMY
ncbi:PREDICTED: uncharacterized protein LOC108371492 isoform X1 [Rhagoletis zephyria]|uniref:uncharacterized protein LOC108371492 isoform X1 n=1 Tax=Rhagoletis zephyria TaxID=28612 RepID=UPI000811416C|nr:PREDICTED: uncharacterized protein LOC108371492 isoform X1 [Rhagoletis zephyria]